MNTKLKNKWGVVPRIGTLAGKLLLTATIVLSAVAVQPAFGQGVPPSGKYSVIPLTLPYNNLTFSTPGSVDETNLALGWSAIVNVTNTSTTWNSSSNAFITTTNIVSATNTTYATGNIQNQRTVMLIESFKAMAASTAWRTSRFSPYLDSGTIDTNRFVELAIQAKGTATAYGSTNIPESWIGGAGGVEMIYDCWGGTNSVAITNSSVKYGNKQLGY